MQVNKCTQPQQSFGMALKIKSEAVDALKKMPRAEIEKLAKIGSDLKDTKYYDLEIGKDGNRMVTSTFANKYKGGSFSVKEPDSEFLPFNATWEGTEIYYKKGSNYHDYIKFADKEAALKAYKDISGSHGVERDAKMVKYLDSRQIAKDNATQATKQEQGQVNDMVDKLFNDYGTIA